MPYRWFYFRGSITFGGFSWLHRFQSSISSWRLRPPSKEFLLKKYSDL
jgi:hypothetical protein